MKEFINRTAKKQKRAFKKQRQRLLDRVSLNSPAEPTKEPVDETAKEPVDLDENTEVEKVTKKKTRKSRTKKSKKTD